MAQPQNKERATTTRTRRPKYPIPPPVESPIIKDNRHDFGAPLRFQRPSPLDLVFRMTAPILEDYNQQSWAHSIDPLLVKALSISPTCFYGMDTTSAVHCLVRHETYIKVQLKVVCDMDLGWAAGTVMVKDGDRWISLREWLQTLPTPKLALGSKGYEMQYRWWRSMDKPFRFNDLPCELKELVLLFSLGDCVTPHLVGKNCAGARFIAFTRSGEPANIDWCCGGRHSQLPKPPKLNVSMLLLDKSTREIALSVLSSHTQKSQEVSHLLRPSPVEWRYLRSVQLCLSISDYIHFFHVDILPFNAAWQNGTAAPAKWLSEVPNLIDLDIFFRSPDDWHSDPFTGTADQREKTLARAPLADSSRLPCLRNVMVDWIMAFAAEHIINVPCVKLKGYVDPATKAFWENVLALDRWDHTAVIEAKKSEIRNLPQKMLPPECFCSTPCYHW